MVSAPLPYIMPLFLGMTFDARFSKPGIDIFDMKDVNNPIVSEVPETKSFYKVATSMSEVLKALDITGDLSLKIKTGMISGKGSGSFIKNERDYHNSVMVITRLLYKSKTFGLPDNAKPRDNWQKHPPSVLGTHFVSSINYGAEMIAVAKFIVDDVADMDKVRGQIDGAFGKGGDGTKLVAEGKLEKLRGQLENNTKLEISYYGTVPLESIPNTIEGLRELVEKFSELVSKTENKNGIPLSVNLSPLTQLVENAEKEKYRFIKNELLEDKLAEFEEDIDELRQARLDLSMYTRKLPFDMDISLQKEVGDLFKTISLTLQKYFDVAWSMDLSKGPEQLDPAFESYNYDGEKKAKRFKFLVENLIYKLDTEVTREKVASDTYIQWGKDSCTAESTQVLYDGFVFTSTEDGRGGMGSYHCFPREPEKSYDIRGTSAYSHLAGVRYADIDKSATNPFKGPNKHSILGKGVPCAQCYSHDATSVTTFVAKEECPIRWDLMYKGYLMSARPVKSTSEYICVDEEPGNPYEMEKTRDSENTLALSIIATEGSLPTDLYPDGSLIPCVVCAINSNQIYM